MGSCSGGFLGVGKHDIKVECFSCPTRGLGTEQFLGISSLVLELRHALERFLRRAAQDRTVRIPFLFFVLDDVVLGESALAILRNR
jgi:hypothetical protein